MPSSVSLRKVLRHIPDFAALPGDTLDGISHRLLRREYQPGELIWRIGRAIEFLGIIQKGEIVLEYRKNGRLVHSSLLQAGAVVRPFAMPTAASGARLSARAMTEVRIYYLHKEDLPSREARQAYSEPVKALSSRARGNVFGESVTTVVIVLAIILLSWPDLTRLVSQSIYFFSAGAGDSPPNEEAHRRRYGFIVPDKTLIVDSVSIEAIGKTEAVADPLLVDTNRTDAAPRAIVPFWAEGSHRDAPVLERAEMRPGHEVAGPAIILETTSTTIVEPGWAATATRRGHLVLERRAELARRAAIGTSVDPVMLEIFNNLFMSIAEQMGSTLEKTSYSVNIKERLDFSCALFDQQGRLIANAPHMPVHLGSMGESVETVIRANRDATGRSTISPGDVYVLNAPYNGGTHLPDVTVITPVFSEDTTELALTTK